MKRETLANNFVYHVFTKSIAGYCIFRDEIDYARMSDLIKYYRLEKPPTKFSAYIKLKDRDQFFSKYCSEKEKIVDIVAYCMMPTHLHIALKQLKSSGISIFMGNVLKQLYPIFQHALHQEGAVMAEQVQACCC